MRYVTHEPQLWTRVQEEDWLPSSWGGTILKGLAAEYGVSKASISNWTKQFREECQKNEEAQADYDFMKENLKLKRQLAELQKENDFLKKAAAFFAKEID